MNKEVDLANRRGNATKIVVEAGQDDRKSKILNHIVPEKYATNHRNRLCHIHDLEFYDVTYNCIGVTVSDLIGNDSMSFAAMLRRLGRAIVELSNMQSGGIGFINFDSDISKYLAGEQDEEIIEAFKEFYLDLNMYTRKGCENPYVTFNFGLDTSKDGRRCSILMMEAYLRGDDHGYPFIFPNLVFKMKKGVNLENDSQNYDVYQKALQVTARRMVPTYFNCDSKSNRAYDADDIGIMGCRTRVVANVNGKTGSKNRGNVACVTLNLVQLAYRSQHQLDRFYELLNEAMEDAKLLLLHRMKELCSKADFTEVYKKNYYLNAKSNDAFEMLKNGTLSIGFIGLWDAIAVLFDIEDLTVDKMMEQKEKAMQIIKKMREYVDKTTEEEHLNFSLLASAAEGVTGNFATYDSTHDGVGSFACEKGYYTNSFHVPVSTDLDYVQKVDLEGCFHELCNGGSITYMELNEMPGKNIEAVQEVVEYAYQNDCNYVGVNFRMDHCLKCGFNGRIRTTCPACESNEIQRLRRVSGYLSEEDSFTVGKRKELMERVQLKIRGQFI